MSEPSESAALRNARLYYAAYTIDILSYGIYVVLTLRAIDLMLTSKRKRDFMVSLLYSAIMFGVTSARFITNVATNEVLFIEETYNQAFKFSLYCSSPDVATNALLPIQITVSDAFLLFRTYIIWDRSILFTLPGLGAWISYIAVMIIANMSCIPTATSLEGILTDLNFVSAYYTLPVVCNAYCTFAICGKLLWHQHRLRCHGIPSNKQYMVLTSMIAESGLFYSVAGVTNVVLTVHENPLSNISYSVWCALVCITPAQIILRVALGIDYHSTSTSHETTHSIPIAFARPHPLPVEKAESISTAHQEGR